MLAGGRWRLVALDVSRLGLGEVWLVPREVVELSSERRPLRRRSDPEILAVDADLEGHQVLGPDLEVLELVGQGAQRGLPAAQVGEGLAHQGGRPLACKRSDPRLGLGEPVGADFVQEGVEAQHQLGLARLRLELAGRPLAPGSVVVLDEVSQVSTRDAATVLAAVATTPGAELWCLGDPRQSQAVGSGGLAAEVARLGAEGPIPAPALVVNRRQRHVADQSALAELRAGRAEASQALRTEQGWEHEEPTPAATREAMADAVAVDVERSGPETVVALAVSHADCEDLADRIRARLVASGRIAGPALSGPGWGSGPQRRYARGDRVLLHTKPGSPGLHNGSTGTVVAVADDGLRVAFDGHGEVVLAAAFVAGRRGDGNPNCSHAWARTIDGAQGGTWEAVHLLGSASLDALAGYTGQSRGRAPTTPGRPGPWPWRSTAACRPTTAAPLRWCWPGCRVSR